MENYVDLRSRAAADGIVYDVGTSEVVPSEGQSAIALRAGIKERYAKFSHRFASALAPLVRRISKMTTNLMCLGAACTGEDLDRYKKSPHTLLDCDWKGEHPDLLVTASGSVHIRDIMSDLHNTSDLVLIEAASLATSYKEKALRVKSSTSSKQWREFCTSQLSGNVGAGILHRFVNRQNAVPAVALFKPGPSGAVPKTPNEAPGC